MKKILYVSGSRAEYGIMKRLLKKIKESNEIDLKLIVTGMHLDEKYGFTYKNIEEDGFEIYKRIDINTFGNDNKSILDSMSIGLKKFSELFCFEKFDAIILLGDRYEILPVSIAAAMNNIPIIHIHGGEKTLGNYDEFIRHSITKMSRFHITSTEEYRKRVIQLGESPENVKNLGALGAENSFLLKRLKKEELEKIVGKLEKEYFVVLFHPETLTNVLVENQMKELINAIDEIYIKSENKYEFIFIGSNSDTGSEKIVSIVDKYIKRRNFKKFISLRPEEFQSLVMYSKGIIGNSSSGIIEVPSLKVPTINIGNRQLGRVMGESVINCNCVKEDIVKSIELSISNEFIKKVRKSKNPYFKENTLENYFNEILNFLKTFKNNMKDFWDINYDN